VTASPAKTHRPGTVLVTGGCGFIGTNFVRQFLGNDPKVKLVNVDLLTYAGRRENLADVEADYGGRYSFVRADIGDAGAVADIFRRFEIDTVVHLAAESHVDRSIDAPAIFIRTNVIGTYNLLNAAREAWQKSDGVRFHHVSTDEVFGSLGAEGAFSETTPYDPSSPYSASKASSDHLVMAWHRTYGLPVTLSNCSNNYGPHQFPEKLIPLMIAKALTGETLPVYGDGGNVRDWLYVSDHCAALELVVRSGAIGETYLIGGRCELTNLALVRKLCEILDSSIPRTNGESYAALITFVKDRPGHDRRYAIDPSRIERDLGWKPREGIESGLRKTIDWYRRNENWIASVRGSSYGGERLGISD
jgi:dTDP-glucose 4,6-dehydratase